ncbi:hypothetical protein [Bosea thiooxidans]
MTRLAVTLSCFALAAGLSSAAGAAGPVGGAQGGSAPRIAGSHLRAAPSFRAAGRWRLPGHPAHGLRHHRGGVVTFGDAWPWYDPGMPMGGVTIVERQAEAPPIDPYSFENLRARTGIRPAPTPEPALYRLEGPRERPVTRVIPIAGTEPARANSGEASARSRVAHAETGALLLTVPSR